MEASDIKHQHSLKKSKSKNIISMTGRERHLSREGSPWHEENARGFCRHDGLIFIIPRSMEVFFSLPPPSGGAI
jgi:hypothetical protein